MVIEPMRSFRVLPEMGGSPRKSGITAFALSWILKPFFQFEIAYTDKDGEALKVVEILQQELVGDAWTAVRFRARNVQTGHTTDVKIDNMRTVSNLPANALSPAQLSRGAPRVD